MKASKCEDCDQCDRCVTNGMALLHQPGGNPNPLLLLTVLVVPHRGNREVSIETISVLLCIGEHGTLDTVPIKICVPGSLLAMCLFPILEQNSDPLLKD